MSGKRKKSGRTGKLTTTALTVSLEPEDNSSPSLEQVSLESILSTSDDSDSPESKDQKSSKLLVEDNAVKKALAEISFIEANETLEKGDVPNAVLKYREAINYLPNNSEYYLKLLEVLKQDVKYKVDFDVLVKDINKRFPDNVDIKAKIQEIKLENNSEVKKDSKTNILKTLTSEREIKATDRTQIEYLKKTNTRETKRTKALTTEKASQADKVDAPARMKKQNNNFFVYEEIKKQSRYAKLISLAILILLPIMVIWALNNSYKETIIETFPIAPDSQTNLSSQQIYFCWTSTSDKVDYLLQIEQEGKPVLERYTKEKFYLVSGEDAQLIKKNTFCTWRAIPISPKRVPLKYKTVEGQFMLVNETNVAYESESKINVKE